MRRAYEMAGLTPEDVNVAEVHDCFSVMGAIGAEVIGKAKVGEGAKYWGDGKAGVDGECGINLSGGLIAKGHPDWRNRRGHAGHLLYPIDGAHAGGFADEESESGRDVKRRRRDLRLRLHGAQALGPFG